MSIEFRYSSFPLSNIFCLLFFMWFASLLKSQDTIYFMNKKKEVAKVLEVGIDEVRFKRFNNLEGPVFIKFNTQIDSILFKNGEVQKLGPGSGRISLSTSGKGFQRIVIKGENLSYDDQPVTERILKRLIVTYPDSIKQKELWKHFAKMRVYKKVHHTWIIGGPIAAATILFTTGVLASEQTSDADMLIAAGVLAGGGMAALSLNMARINKKKWRQQRILIATIYNGM